MIQTSKWPEEVCGLGNQKTVPLAKQAKRRCFWATCC
jgi:hypothetical protein